MKKDDIIKRMERELDVAKDYHIEMKYGRNEDPYVVEIVALVPEQKENNRLEIN